MQADMRAEEFHSILAGRLVGGMTTDEMLNFKGKRVFPSSLDALISPTAHR
jgi:hypothetical protein